MRLLLLPNAPRWLAACLALGAGATSAARAQVVEPEAGSDSVTEFAVAGLTADTDLGGARVDLLLARVEGELQGSLAGLGVSRSLSEAWTVRLAYFGFYQEDVDRPDPRDDRLRVEATWSGTLFGLPITERIRVERRFRDVEDETRLRPETTIHLPALGPFGPYVAAEPFLSDQDGFEQVLLRAGATVPMSDLATVRASYAYGVGSGQPDSSVLLFLLQLHP